MWQCRGERQSCLNLFEATTIQVFTSFPPTTGAVFPQHKHYQLVSKHFTFNNDSPSFWRTQTRADFDGSHSTTMEVNPSRLVSWLSMQRAVEDERAFPI